jgi:hypothetical protein
MENYEIVVQNYISKNVDALGGQNAYDQLTDGITFAWENWEQNVLATFFTGNKPEKPPTLFVSEWIETELSNNPDEWENILT